MAYLVYFKTTYKINELAFKHKNAYNIDEIKDKVTWKICLGFSNPK
jgi:hypothetical protein